ncbi:MAG TPA: hypothetical protein VM598_07635 [Bdellovibrionota bacterium]|nr:hypothetical protein [Bdellovibrionota bacterium]
MSARILALLIFAAALPPAASASRVADLDLLSDAEVASKLAETGARKDAQARAMRGILHRRCVSSTIHTLVAGVPALTAIVHPIRSLRGSRSEALRLAANERDPAACRQAIQEYGAANLEYTRIKYEWQRLSDEDGRRIRAREQRMKAAEREQRMKVSIFSADFGIATTPGATGRPD